VPEPERRPNLWRQRSFQIFWTGETVSQLGSSITFVLLPLTAVRLLHASAFLVSLITAAVWLPWLLIGLPAGAFVDHLPARHIMLVCDLISIAAMASVPFAAWAGVLTMAQVLAVALVGGACSVLFRTAYQVYLPTFVERPDLAEANAKLTGASSATDIGGPGIGGVIAQLAGAATGMLADAVSFAVSFVCLTRMPADHRHTDQAARSPRALLGNTVEGVRFLVRDPLLRPMAIFAAVGNFGFTGFDAILVFFLVRTLHLSSALVGFTLALLGVGGVLGAVAARPLAKRYGSARVAVRGLLVGLPFALLIPLTHNGVGLTYLFAGDLIAATSIGAANVMIITFVQSYSPPEMLGRVSSAVRTCSHCAMPVGAAIAGVLASELGIRAALWAFTACIAGSALILLATPARRLRDFPTRADLSTVQVPSGR
jgi:predicted MFS family arabinose efflux permease